ncbi:MAG: hypothetical protein KatS3mg069_2797 [Meiothermus sp.]|nr:MAG: hypothetical protein KatS3mg069_2797 [Meiothermus sp.]
MANQKGLIAQQIKQGSRLSYLFKVQAGELIGRTKPDVFDPKSQTGYQRQPERSRGLAFARYIEAALNQKEASFPGTILLAYRGEVDAKPLGGDLYTISLPPEMYVVDGQHRLLGLEIAIKELQVSGAEEIEVPVMLLSHSDMYVEAEFFRIINETAKKVRTDLARRLLALRLQQRPLSAEKSPMLQPRSWEVKASEIISILNKHSSVWAGRIQFPNERRRPSHTIKDKSFGDSLRPLLTTFPFQDLDPRVIATGIDEFWLGVKKLMDTAPDNHLPNPFDDPKDYVLLKAIPGVFAMHLVLRYLWTLAYTRGKKTITQDFVFEALKKAAEVAARDGVDARFDTRASWRSDSTFALYGGLKGATGLGRMIIAYLKEAEYDLTGEEEE